MKKIMLMLLAFVLMSCSTTDTDTGSGTNPNPIVPLPNELTGTWELSEKELMAIDGTTGTTLDSFFIFKDDKTLTIKGGTGTVLATAKIESSENLSLALGSDPATEVGVAFAKFDTTSAIHADKYIAFVATDWNLYMSRIGDSIADVKANLLLTDATGGPILAFSNSSVATEPVFIANSDAFVDQLQGDWGLSRTALKDIAGTEKVASYSFYNIADKAVTIKDNKTGAVIGAATIEDTVSKMRVNQTVIDVYTLTVGADKVVFYMDGESILVSPVGTIEAIKAEVSRKELTVLLHLSDMIDTMPTVFPDFATVYAPFKSSTAVNTWVGERPFVNELGQSADATIPRAIFVDDTKVTLGGTLVAGDIEKALSPEKLRVTLDGATSSTWVNVIWSKFTVGLNGKYVGYFIEGSKLYSTIVGTQEEIRADLVVADKKVKVLSLEMTDPDVLKVLTAALVGEWANSITPINNWTEGEIIPTAATYTFDADGVATITAAGGFTMTATPVRASVSPNPAIPTGTPPAMMGHFIINATRENGFMPSIALQSKNGALLLELKDSSGVSKGFVGAFVFEDMNKRKALYITRVAAGIPQFKSQWGSGIPEIKGNDVYGVVVSKTP